MAQIAFHICCCSYCNFHLLGEVSCLGGNPRLTAWKVNGLLCSADYGFSHAEVQLRKEISYCRTQAIGYSRIEHYLGLSIVNLRLVQDAFTYV